MSAHARPRPMGGPIWSKPFAALALVAAIGLGLIAYRLAVGLGAVTNLSDGNPWGLWIAADVVIGTAFACGGYAAALLVYVFNRGQLHPLVRPALVTSLLGYTMGVVGVALDVGRPWLIWKVPFTPSHWNYDSVLFEVALCIGAYVIVLFIEASPIWLEKLAESRRTGLARLAKRTAGFLERALPFILALGLLLPTMHQSSLGSLMLVAGAKVHPLWQTGWLPFLFLISVLAMGWAVITFETTLANHSLRLPVETDMLRKLWAPITGSLVVFTVVRFADLAMKGRLGLAFDSGYLSAAFWLETTLILGGALLLAVPSMRARRSSLFTIALLVLAGGSLYRLDTFILAFNPGSRWAYFPSAIETFVTVGIIALEMLLWIVIVKRLPVLAPATPEEHAVTARITIDPVTRIEGHLRIDAEVSDGQVQKAWSSGQMFRGIELILKDRDPREAWLFTQRICGVCTTVHAIASVRAVENALGLEIPYNAQLVRNMLVMAHALHDHIVHFYHLSALDFVDVTKALKADPVAASKLAESLSEWPGNSRHQLRATQEKVKGFVQSGQLGIFANGYWGHPAMKLPPEVNLLAVDHYLQALEYQRKANQIVAILGGKTPNIQNLAVGGISNPIDPDSQAALNMERLSWVRDLFREVRAFVEQVYLPDVIAIAAMNPDWLGYGAGVLNYMAVPDLPTNAAATEFDLPGGTIMNADLETLKSIDSFGDAYFRENVTENVTHAWYEGGDTLHPYEGVTAPEPGKFDPEGKYSWVKSPRFDGKPMQVGPLAQMLVGYAKGDPRIVKRVDYVLDTASSLAGTKLTPKVLHSTLGRHAARCVRAHLMAELAESHWDRLIDNIGKGDLESFVEPVFPKGRQQGFGFHEAPRGVLSHWVVIEDGRIANYQAVVPSTWNAGPRDENGQMGPYEASLVGNPVADPERPLELLRTVHSFDPCLACAIHTHDPEAGITTKVMAL